MNSDQIKVVDMNGKELAPGMKVMIRYMDDTHRPAVVIETFPDNPTICDEGHWVDVDSGEGSEGMPSYILEAIDA